MFNWIVRASLGNRLLVLAVAVILMAYGAFTAWRTPVDVFPDLNKPLVTVITEAGGMAPQEVELLASFPIETALNGMPGVTRVRSVSGVGLSIVYAEFERLLGSLNAGLGAQECRRAFAQIDTDHDGAVAFDEFAAWWAGR